MSVNLTEYKKTHKSADQIELERREAILDKALEELNQASNQMGLKYNNLPTGTHATLEEVDFILCKMGEVSRANRYFREQQRKMGLRPWENETEDQKANKVVSIFNGNEEEK